MPDQPVLTVPGTSAQTDANADRVRAIVERVRGGMEGASTALVMAQLGADLRRAGFQPLEESLRLTAEWISRGELTDDEIGVTEYPETA